MRKVSMNFEITLKLWSHQSRSNALSFAEKMCKSLKVRGIAHERHTSPHHPDLIGASIRVKLESPVAIVESLARAIELIPPRNSLEEGNNLEIACAIYQDQPMYTFHWGNVPNPDNWDISISIYQCSEEELAIQGQRA